MLIPKKNRRQIYEYLFNEGVVVVKKDFHAPSHDKIQGVPNLQVVKLMQSFKSRGFVRETFAWRHYYYYLKNEGVEYLRECLGLPAEVVPATLKVKPRPDTDFRRQRGEFGGRGFRRGDRDEYRRQFGSEGQRPFGRGAPMVPPPQ